VPRAATTEKATQASTTKKASQEHAVRAEESEAEASSDYVLPIVGVHAPAKVVDVGFWVSLAGAVAFGAVDPPLGVLLGACVVIARHRSAR
jgi:hypothetical protein